jgi:cell division protein FtsB
MKPIAILLTVTFLGLQYKLWFGEGSVPHVYQLKQQLQNQQLQNQSLFSRNSEVEAELVELKSGNQSLVEIARNELGMVKSGEVYYQIID